MQFREKIICRCIALTLQLSFAREAHYKLSCEMSKRQCSVQIVDVVKPLRDQLDACLVFPSMPAVMKMNKLGTFSMAQLGESKSPIASFMKSMRKSNDNFEESMLKLVRTLPTVLKYLPSQKAQVCSLPTLHSYSQF